MGNENASIYILADLLGADIELTRFCNQNNRWIARFDNCDVKDKKSSSIISGTYGNGTSPEGAISDYILQIKGKVLVFNSMRDNRTEYNCPNNLTL